MPSICYASCAAGAASFLSSTLDPADVPIRRVLDSGLSGPVNNPVPPATVDAIEAVGLDGRHDSPDLARGQRDQVRIAPHEAHEPAVRCHGDRVARPQHTSAICPARPMEDGAALEVPTTLDQR